MKRGQKAQPLILAVLSLFFHLGNLSLGQNPIAVLAEELAEPDPITFNYPGPFQSGYWHDSTRYPSELPFIVYADGYGPTDFTFSTSDPEIAYIYAPYNVGLQIGDPGFATITATLNSDPSKSYSVEIEVYDCTFIQDGSYHWDDCFYAYDTGYITFDVTSNSDYLRFVSVHSFMGRPSFEVNLNDMFVSRNGNKWTFKVRFRTGEASDHNDLFFRFSENPLEEGHESFFEDHYDIEKYAHIRVDEPDGLCEALSFAPRVNALCNNHDPASWAELASMAPNKESALDFLVNKANYVLEEGVAIKKRGKDHQTLAEAISRYDFMVSAYGYSDFLGRNPSPQRELFAESKAFGEEHASISLLLVVTLVPASGIVFFLIQRRKGEDDRLP